MFNEISLRRFRFFSLQLEEKFRFNYRYVYSEEQNDFIDIHSKLWETRPTILDSRNQEIKLSSDRNLGFPNVMILNLLHYTIKFIGRGYIDPNGMNKTYLGYYDLNLMPATRTNQFESLLPHVKIHDKIWINNLSLKGSQTYFIDLFDEQLWIAFLTTFALIGMISTIGIILLKKFKKTEIDFLNWYSIIMNQGAQENSEFVSRRFLLISLSMVTIIFHGAFEAFMSSGLAIRHPDLPFSDIKSLLNLPYYTICVLPRSAALDQITYDASKLSKPAAINSDASPNLFRNFDGSPNSIRRSEMLCPRKNMAYVGVGMCFLPAISRQCPLIPVDNKLSPEYITMVMYPGFKYAEQFNQGILRLMVSGNLPYIVNQFNRKQLYEICAERVIAADPEMHVTLYQIRLLILILWIGIASSIIVVAIELLYTRIFRERL